MRSEDPRIVRCSARCNQRVQFPEDVAELRLFPLAQPNGHDVMRNRHRTFRSAFALFVFIASSTSAQLIEDFETYEDTPDLLNHWTTGILDIATPNAGAGTQSLLRGTDSPGNGSGTSTRTTYSPPLDLTGNDELVVQARRHPLSAFPLRFSIAAIDLSGNSCIAEPQPLLSDTEWHTIVLDLESRCGAVDLDEIDQIMLSVLNYSGGPAEILGNFDNLTARSGALFADGFEGGNTNLWQ